MVLLASLAGWGSALAEQVYSPATEIARLDLAKLFHPRSDWRLVAMQGPPATDYGDNPAPGAIRLCLEKGAAGPCISTPMPARQTGDTDDSWAPHYLRVAKAVYPRGPSAAPLLLIVTASVHAGDGGQLVVTQLLKYRRSTDTFDRVFDHATGTNNNEEVRFVEAGPLRGSVIIAEPTDKAPFAYWVVVDSPSPADAYKLALKYRSATRYGDGNSLAVIDSEMPNIEQRLGLWRTGSPLPLPAGPCPKPRLVRGELWCS